jgi:hypothetical protein
MIAAQSLGCNTVWGRSSRVRLRTRGHVVQVQLRHTSGSHVGVTGCSTDAAALYTGVVRSTASYAGAVSRPDPV